MFKKLFKIGDQPYGKSFRCINKHEFMASEKTSIDTCNMGGESIVKDACPVCKTDMIFYK